MEKGNDKDKEKEKEKSWYVFDSYFRCYGNPGDCQWKFEKRKKDLHRHGAPSNPPPPTGNPPPPTGNRQLPPLAPQNRPRPRNPVAPTAYYADGTFVTRVHYSGQMVVTWSKQYLGGKVQRMTKCDPEKWSKVEVDGVLEKQGVDVRGLDYYYLKPGKDLDGLVKLIDNNSWKEMANIGYCKGGLDLFALENTEMLNRQTPPPSEGNFFLSSSMVL